MAFSGDQRPQLCAELRPLAAQDRLAELHAVWNGTATPFVLEWAHRLTGIRSRLVRSKTSTVELSFFAFRCSNILSDEETRGGTALQHRALACCQEISQGDLRYGEIQAAIQQPCISFLA